MNRLLRPLIAGFALMTLAVGLASMPAYAVTCSGKGATPNSPLCKAQSGANKVGANNSQNKVSVTTRVHNIINLLIYVLSAVAVIMIVVGGIQYVTSSGDQSSMTSAKNTIMYSVIGLVVALMAYSIVSFVISKVG